MTDKLTPELYTSRVERIYERLLEARMVGYLTTLADAFRGAGYDVSGPHDLSDDEYRWYIAVEGNGLSESVDVSLELAESLAYEGETDGVNIGVSIVSYEGSILGELTPYNYTPNVWASLRDLHEIIRRMEIIEQSNAESAIALVDEFRNK